MNYYNEFDSFAADWLENLIAAELIPAGVVDRRSIKEVQPGDLNGYKQAHFFAGIGGWPEALRLARWTGPCWTGSCPCQPFSAAGKRKGSDDERHLWPEFYRLISECCPPVVFGEQVASKDGREWLSRVFADLEELGYETAGADLCAPSVGAPHIRQRLWWVADAGCERLDSRSRRPRNTDFSRMHWEEFGADGKSRGMAHSNVAELRRKPSAGEQSVDEQNAGLVRLGEPSRKGLSLPEQGKLPGSLEQQEGRATEQPSGASVDRMAESTSVMGDGRQHEQERGPDGRTADRGTGPWSGCTTINCIDGRPRRIESGAFPLAHGIPRKLGHLQSWLAAMAKPARSNRVGRLKGYGNAIVPSVAAEFVAAFMETIQ